MKVKFCKFIYGSLHGRKTREWQERNKSNFELFLVWEACCKNGVGRTAGSSSRSRENPHEERIAGPARRSRKRVACADRARRSTTYRLPQLRCERESAGPSPALLHRVPTGRGHFFDPTRGSAVGRKKRAQRLHPGLPSGRPAERDSRFLYAATCTAPSC